MRTASSAAPTCGASTSRSECTAIARTPSVASVRITRTAISPRLATSTDSNTAHKLNKHLNNVNSHETIRAMDVHRNLIGRVNVGDMVTRSAARDPHAEAVIDGERRFTYADFNAAVNRVANALRARGYERGDALALVSGNSVEFLLAYY